MVGRKNLGMGSPSSRKEQPVFCEDCLRQGPWCPRDKQKLARHRSQGCAPNAPEDRTRHPAGQRAHPGSREWPAPVDRP